MVGITLSNCGDESTIFKYLENLAVNKVLKIAFKFAWHVYAINYV